MIYANGGGVVERKNAGSVPKQVIRARPALHQVIADAAIGPVVIITRINRTIACFLRELVVVV